MKLLPLHVPVAKGVGGLLAAIGLLGGGVHADPSLATIAVAMPPVFTNAHDTQMGIYTADSPDTFNGYATTFIPSSCTQSGDGQCSALAVTFQVIIDNSPSGVTLNQFIKSTDDGPGTSQSLAMVVQ